MSWPDVAALAILALTSIAALTMAEHLREKQLRKRLERIRQEHEANRRAIAHHIAHLTAHLHETTRNPNTQDPQHPETE